MDYIIKELWWYFEIIGTGKSKLIIIKKKKKKIEIYSKFICKLVNWDTRLPYHIWGMPVTRHKLQLYYISIFQMHLYDLQKKKKKEKRINYLQNSTRINTTNKMDLKLFKKIRYFSCL